MGAGIIEVFARAGHDVVATDVSEQAMEAGRARLRSSLDRAARAGKITPEDSAAALARVSFRDGLESFADRDLVIEAIIERLEDKLAMFERLDRIVINPDAVLASNTSSIPIIDLAMATARPEQVIGLHFFNPVPVMGLVEVIASMRTSADVRARVETLVEKDLQKAIIAASDRAGFVVNALLIPYLLSAIRMYEAKFASAESIDAGMEKGCGHPMGPLRLADFIGLDTVKLIADSLYEEYREPQFVAPSLLIRMVKAGALGRKSGAGFYDYNA
jgi:3-hydroxybutyryl-CoA dehydrogenase